MHPAQLVTAYIGNGCCLVFRGLYMIHLTFRKRKGEGTLFFLDLRSETGTEKVPERGYVAAVSLLWMFRRSLR